MNIDSLTQGNQIAQESIKINTKDLAIDEVKKKSDVDKEKKTSTSKDNTSSLLDTETKFTLDKASGLLQSITTDKITDKIIRKMPSDEYLKLLHVMDDIISGSVKTET